MKKEEECCNNNLGIVSFVLGIVSLAFSILIVPPVITAITSIIFGWAQLKRSKSRLAVWGIVLSIITILAAIVLVWQIIVMIGNTNEFVTACMANPSAPGCEQVAAMMGGTQ